ncbi:DUF86 domain-containing protein [Halobacillus sp. Marseille-Q1614]|uniref:DUF86 domain-containing protein n=1 Tax=Halobacillus sp. Marseille-Q1614 TaxID=2709134 RepID=UPI00156EA8DB|nr:DUF86 domain-containing protein [Halobacillus sp. Marseille-Q1614]
MYFVDRHKIEGILAYMEKLMDEKAESYTSFKEKLLLERLTHLVIESIIDVGNQMIDGFIMRDPGSYEDIIDILTDEKVLPEENTAHYKAFIQLRKSIVQEYLAVDHDHIEGVWADSKEAVKSFPGRIRRYLDEEIGPVSAFSNANE